MTVEFMPGEKYRNRRGEYEVLELSNNGKLRVRYLADGFQVELDQTQQARIISNMQEEQTAEAQRAAMVRPVRVVKKTSSVSKAKPKIEKDVSVTTEAKPAVAKKPRSSAATAATPPAVNRMEPLSEVRTQFTRQEVLQLAKFIGYGKSDGAFWFIGPDETGYDDGNITLSERIALNEFNNEFVDACLHKDRLEPAYRIFPYFSSWQNINYLVTRMLLEPDLQTESGRNQYFIDRFGALDGDLLLADILSLPAANLGLAHWPYRHTTITDSPLYNTTLRDPARFQEDQLLGRGIRLQRLAELYSGLKLEKCAPEFVICHGTRSNWKFFKGIFPELTGFTEIELKLGPDKDRLTRIEVARDDNGTVVLLAPYLSSKENITPFFLDHLADILKAQKQGSNS